MTRQPRIGLLPLYLKLYDETLPEWRKEFAPFLAAIQRGFEERGVAVTANAICCVEAEFREAIARFEQAGVDLIVGLHLAYSPSLESAGALTDTGLPLLLLDTTMDYDFGCSVSPDRIGFNHGIHGVQDLASVLRRNKRPFEIVAGHVTESDVLARAADVARAAYAAQRLRATRALRLGAPFRGMGDFAVEAAVLRRAFGVETDTAGIDDLARAITAVTSDEIAEEMRLDHAQFQVEADAETHARTTRVCLGLRRLLEHGGASGQPYSAFSMNFLIFDRADGPACAVPFLEASKAMARGIGYGGEGDVLTACLVGALGAAFGETTFTEIFCPDWKGNALYLSHMGELNPEIAAEPRRLVAFDFPFTPARNPAILACAFRPGDATLVNIVPGPDESFSLIASEVEVLGDSLDANMRNRIRAWIRPNRPLGEFLEAYSRLGGTHHSALVYGKSCEALQAFGAFAGLPISII